MLGCIDGEQSEHPLRRDTGLGGFCSTGACWLYIVTEIDVCGCQWRKRHCRLARLSGAIGRRCRPRASRTVGGANTNSIIGIIADVTISYGLGGLNSDGLADQLSLEEVEQFGAGGLDEYWQWGGTAYGQSQWLSVGDRSPLIP